MADTTIITGQYVRISQTPANLGERFLARMIDIVFIAVYVFATVAAINALPYGFKNNWMFTVILFALYLPILLYSLLFEVFNEGQSPGKKIMNIKVVMADGSTPALGSYLLRWLLYSIDVPVTGGLGILFILLTKNNQRIGDLAAGTMVVRLNNYRKVKVSLDEYKHLTEGYVPVYPQVTDLSLEQVSVVEKVLALTDNKRYAYISQLSAKLKDMMKVDVKTSDELFLHTIVKDYQYYAYIDI